MKFRLNVIKEGDLEYLAEFKDGVRVLRPFLKSYMTDYRGISRYSGRIPYRDGEVTVEYETTPKTRSIYLYAPKIMLTAQQVKEKQHISLGIQSCLEMARWIQTVGGWKLGLPEVTDWKVHYGVDDRVEFGEIARRVYARTPDRKTWISDSEGKTEWETCDPDLVQIRLMLPQEVLNLKKELSQLQEAIPQTFEAFRKEVIDFKREVGSLLQDFRTSLLNDIFGYPSKDKAGEGRDETQGLMYR